MHHPTRRDALKASLTLGAAACGFANLTSFVAAAESPPAQMLTRKIPSTGELVPVVGLGTFRAFDPPSLQPEHLKPLEEVLKIFYAGGGRCVDTAPSYGKSEQVVGIVSKTVDLNDKLFFATKVLERGKDAGERSFRQSLERLQRDKIELMQVHNFVDWKNQLPLLRAWKEKGTFRYIGVTHYQSNQHDELEQIIRKDRPDFLQLNYNVAEREAQKRLLPAAQDLGIATLINRPFGGGELIGSVRDKPLPDFVKPWAGSWAQGMLKFIIAEEAVTCVIGATSKPHHMKDNLAAGSGPLPGAKDREAFSGLFQ
jgi:diketogulonate reductase-like aldo/keto reductase